MHEMALKSFLQTWYHPADEIYPNTILCNAAISIVPILFLLEVFYRNVAFVRRKWKILIKDMFCGIFFLIRQLNERYEFGMS